MKKFSLIWVCLLCVYSMSNAQTITYAEYFFDADPGVLHEDAIPIPDFTGGDNTDENFDVDVTGLDPGFHWLYVRVFYDDFTVSISQGRRFYIFESASAPAPASDLVDLEYYFDTDPGPGNGISGNFPDAASLDHDFSVDISGLDPGFHFLYVRMRDGAFNWSQAHFRRFYIFEVLPSPVVSSNITKAEYFFDADPGPGNGTSLDFTTSGDQVDETLAIPIGALEPGFHQLGVRVFDGDFKWSVVQQKRFYVFEVQTAPGLSSSIQTVEYFFGTDPGVGNGLVAATDLNLDVVDQDIIIDVDGLAPGTHALSIRMIDEDGKVSIAQTQEITVLDNNFPEVTAASFSVDENAANDTSVGTVSASDADSDDITYAFTEANTIFSIDGSTGEVSVLDGTQLNYEDSTYYVVTVEATDSNGGTGTADFTINVNDVNEAPIMDDVSLTVAENITNGTVVGTLSGDDPESDVLTFAITAGNESGAFAINGSDLEVADGSQLDYETLAMYALTIEASDGEFANEATVTIGLEDVFENNDPVLQNALVDLEFLNGFTTSTVNLTDVFADVDNHNLTYTVASSDVSVVTTSVSGITVTLSEVGPGTSTITATADDGNGGTASDSFLVMVNEPNSPPLLALIADVTTNEGTAVDLTFSATDSDLPSQTLTFSLDAISLGEGMTVEGSTGVFAWTPGAGQTGVHDVTVSVTDGLQEDRQVFEIFVQEVNAAPALETVTDQSVFQDEEITLTAVASDTDVPAQTLIFSLDAISLNKGMVIDASTGTFSWTPTVAHVRVHDVTITVSDGSLEASQSFTIEVIRGNTAPSVLAAPEDVLLTEGFESEEINLQGIFQDAEGDFISYSAVSSVESVATVSVEGTVLSIAEVGLGSSEISITATDELGLSTDVTFGVTVDVAPLSIDDLVAEAVLYPNPAAGTFSVSVDESDFNRLIIYSLDGKVSLEFEEYQNQFPIHDLIVGLYTVVIETTDDSIVTRLQVKEQ